MSMQNLAIVFGPTLFGQHAPVNGQGGVIADTPLQNQVRILSTTIKIVCLTVLNLSGNRNYSHSLQGYLYRRIRMISFFSSNNHDAPFCGLLFFLLYAPSLTLLNISPPSLALFFCFVEFSIQLCACFGQGRFFCWLVKPSFFFIQLSPSSLPVLH